MPSKIAAEDSLIFVKLFLEKNKTARQMIHMKCQINVKKISFGNKEHITDKKMGVSVLLRLFISSNEVCNTA